MLKQRQKMPTQKACERIRNFNSVTLGFSENQAIIEAERCIGCKVPLCVKDCPVGIDIPGFINYIKNEEFDRAIRLIKQKNNLPAICGRVCPQEDLCEKICILSKKDKPVAIGALERFVADWQLNYRLQATGYRLQDTGYKLQAKKKKLLKVAVIGSGPAGLTCAADLAKLGYMVTIFEALHEPGGVLTYGIPEFRLPKKIVQQEVGYVKNLGVEFRLNIIIGRTLTIKKLFKQSFAAMFIGSGAGLPRFLDIPGENLNRIYSANEFLTRCNLMKAYRFPEYDTPINIGKRVCIIGGGNVAIDAARVALRLKTSEVKVLYRRTEREMPARIEEIEYAKQEGIKFKFLTTPKRFIGDDKDYCGVRQIECIKMKLGKPDESGRRRPVAIPNSEFLVDADTVVIAIGQMPHPLLTKATPGLKIGAYGQILVDKKGGTSIEGVFAGGDITTGADTVISAMTAGKKAALAIDKYVTTSEDR